MNGGTGSTLPVRHPITRPVSFHSLPEHQHNSPVYLSPYSHRRPRTPRSSPLAGPSLSSDQVDTENGDDEGNKKPRYRPNRISSTPDMVLPIQSIYDSDSASLSSPSPSPPSTVSVGTMDVVLPIPPIPRPGSSTSSEDGKGKEQAEDGKKRRSFVKRLSIISTSSSATHEKDKDGQKAADRRRSSFILPSASTTSLASSSSSRTARTDKTTHTAPPIPTIPRWALNAMREEAGANRNMKYGHRRGTSDDIATSPTFPLPPLPNQPIPPGVRTSGLSNQPRPPSISRDPRENWMSVTDPTPKFSRLGLGGDAVVMPVSKKDSLAKMKSAGSIRSTASAATLSHHADVKGDSGVTNKIEPGNDSDAADAGANLKEKEGLRRRPSLASSLKAKFPKIILSSSAGSENVPPLPNSTDKSDSTSTSGMTSHTPRPTSSDSMSKTNPTRRSTTSQRSCTLTAIDENQPPPPLPDDTCTESGRKPDDAKSQGTRTRRKSIKQIVMRITTGPISAGEKVKLTTIRDPPSMPMVTLPPDTRMPLEPPSGARFEKLGCSSVSSLPSTKEGPGLAYGRGEVRGSVRFKSIRKKWNAVLGVVRG